MADRWWRWLTHRLGGGAAAAPPRLRLHVPGQPARQVALHGACYRLGRDPSSELALDHPAVSRSHALLERHGNHWLLRDCGSTNGLWWRGRRVRELVLRSGDQVRFGPAEEGGLPELSFDRQARPPLQRALRRAGVALAALTGLSLGVLALSALRTPIHGSLAAVRGPLVLYDRTGRPIASAEDQRHREWQRLSAYPPGLIAALQASEDTRFWWHPGVDPIGTARALITNLLGGRVLEGGSTLTQQLARSLYPDLVGEGETLERKWRELLVALQLEARFSKRDLLLSYLNRVYLGAGWGFEDASRLLFDKPAARLSTGEAALLVGLLPSPNGNDPCVDPAAALAARNGVLAKMVATGRLAADEARRLRREPIRLAPGACKGSQRQVAPFYSDQVRRDLENLVGREVAAEGNFLVDTHLDPALQGLVERLLRQKLEASRSLGVSQGAVVVLDQKTGGILAISGGRDYRQSQFNRASMALRQPGSAFKLVPYVVALERGAKPGDGISCAPLRWQGQLFESGCGGSISLRQALASSSNTAALRLGRRVGLEAVVQKARDLGITTPLQPVPGLVLGQSEVTLLQLTSAYLAVANDGLWHAPSTIRKLTDGEHCPANREEKSCRSGTAASRALTAPRRVMAPATARAMRELLRGVVSGGTGTAAYVHPGTGGKTGTTNEGRDLVFVGFDPARQWVMGIWMGNDDYAPTRASSALPAALWGEIIRASSPTS
ncbi:MAG: FHA domain-containing protein [Cyanobacteria bacterium K_Offshore_surface_m2_239]|nr:FHA domain-containing protein [Cyanobacteria bacterium K_Offshore_surface_m2_239]